jgi:hypothetical protein
MQVNIETGLIAKVELPAEEALYLANILKCGCNYPQHCINEKLSRVFAMAVTEVPEVAAEIKAFRLHSDETEC